MILFCGIASEPPLALAIEAAERLGVEHSVFHQRETDSSRITLECRHALLRGRILLRGRDLPLEEIRGVYTRIMDYEGLPENQANGSHDALRSAKAAHFHRVLNEWLELADCRVVNRASDMASNMSKPYQSQLISKFFTIPPTLVSNEPADVLEFARRHGRVVYKSISSVRSIVRELMPAAIQNLHRIRALPVQFQAYTPGTNIRVHVVGDSVFATEITCDAVDYRYAQRDGMQADLRPLDLPPHVAARCRALAARLRLPFCGIDLKRTAHDDYFCFEVNPSPAYSYYQEQTGQAISEALVRYLVAAAVPAY